MELTGVRDIIAGPRSGARSASSMVYHRGWMSKPSTASGWMRTGAQSSS